MKFHFLINLADGCQLIEFFNFIYQRKKYFCSVQYTWE